MNKELRKRAKRFEDIAKKIEAGAAPDVVRRAMQRAWVSIPQTGLPPTTCSAGLSPCSPMNHAYAYIEGDDILIRIHIPDLPQIVEMGIDGGFLHGGVEITDPAIFARDMVDALNEEDETGETPINALLDNAVTKAIEAGSEGCTLDEDAS